MSLPPLPTSPEPTPASRSVARAVFQALESDGIVFDEGGAHEFQLFAARAVSEYENQPGLHVRELADRIRSIANSDGVSTITADIWDKIKERLCPLMYWC